MLDKSFVDANPQIWFGAALATLFILAVLSYSWSRLTTLRQMTSDNPHQQVRLGDPEPLISAKLSKLARTIGLQI